MTNPESTFRVVLFTDLHIHPFSRFAGMSERGLNTWVEEALHVLDQIYTGAREREIENVLFLGDLFHVGSRLYTRAFNEVYRFFKRQKNEGFRTILIAGNHDRVTRTGTENTLLSLESAVQQIVWDTPEELCCIWGEGVVVILLVPYTESYSALRTCIKEFPRLHSLPKPPTYRVVVGHLAVEGAVAGQYEYQPKEGCSGGLFEGVDMALLGHYHKRQTVTPEVSYIGAAMSHSFSDAGQRRGYTILTASGAGLQTTFIPIEGTSFKTMTPEDVFESDEKLNGAIVRVDYSSGEMNEEGVRQDLLKRGAKVVIFNRDKVREVEERVPDPETNQADCFREYVERNAGDLDKGKLLELSTDIVSAAEESSNG